MKNRLKLIKHNIFFIASFLSFLLMMVPTNTKGLIIYFFISLLIALSVGGSIDRQGNSRMDYSLSSKSSILCFSLALVIIIMAGVGAYSAWLASSKIAALASILHISVEVLLKTVLCIAGGFGVYGTYTFVLCLHLQNDDKTHKYILLAFVSFYIYACTQIIMSGAITAFGLLKAVIGMSIVSMFIAIFLLIIPKPRFSYLLSTFILLLFATINNYVYRFRGSELKPLDFRSVRTAFNVVNNYNLGMPKTVIIIWCSWILLMAWLFSLRYPIRKFPIYVNCGICIASSLLLLFGSSNITPKNWENEGSLKNGTFLNFILEIRDSFVKKPEGYSDNVLSDVDQQYADNTVNTADESKKPSIIVIMNESFTDFEVFGSKINTDTKLLPNIHSLNDNVIKGYAYSSVFGGNTANSEFEFLTGNSMAFLPNGCVPFQQYISGQQYSILRYLHKLNYNCIATHPFFANGWNRPAVYTSFGFDDISFIDDYPNKDFVRRYISDREMYEYVISKYEARDKTANFFLFGITIQNHGSYTDPDFKSLVNIQSVTGYPIAEQFISLEQISDQALSNFIKYFEAQDEPVVICFFGDHQPAVETAFLEDLYGSSLDGLNSQILKYKVPFFVWTNYDIEEQLDVETSINYLSNYVLKAAGINLPPYNQYLYEIQKELPVVNSLGYYSVSEKRYLPINEATGKEKEILNRYNILQYNNMFDKENLSGVFLGD